MLLLGVFCSEDKPVMNMFLRPIVDDFLDRFKEGIERTLVMFTLKPFAFCRYHCSNTSWYYDC